MIMKFLIWRLRLWRRYRRHFLSIEEMSMLNDLTVTEVLLIAKTMKLLEGMK